MADIGKGNVWQGCYQLQLAVLYIAKARGLASSVRRLAQAVLQTWCR